MAATATSVQSPSSTPSAGKPLPPPLQTPLNSATSVSNSPSQVPRPPPSSSVLSPSSTPTVNGSNGYAVSRSKSRPHLSHARSNGRISVADGLRTPKTLNEPHVRTTEHVLRKFRGKPPSLILHLHPTHFRFDQQDGTFGYNSPMKLIMEHLKEQTVPHDILEELTRGGVPFYDGCLIVEVHDHKTTPTTSKTATSELGDRLSWEPYSIHNYNLFITPSPFVRHPSPSRGNIAKPPDASQSSEKDGNDANPLPDGKLRSKSKNHAKKSKVFTTVLHPTSLSRQREVSLLATTLFAQDARSTGKRGSASAARDGSTSLSGTSSLAHATSASGKLSNKKQKVMLDESMIYQFEADILKATEPPLFLEPAGDFESVRNIMKKLTDPLHDREPRKSKGRKRTTAELAADEEQAAEDERFALIMDERLQPSLSARGASGAGLVDSREKAKDFQPDFSRFKTLEDIKRKRDEQAKQQAIDQQQKEAALAQAHARRREAEEKHRQEVLAAQQQRQQQQRQQQMRQQQQQPQVTNFPQMNPMANHSMHPHMMQNIHHNLMQQSQAAQASPISSTHAPANPSPLAGNMFGQGPAQQVIVSTSAQSAGSPPRPTSAAPVNQPPVGHPMARNSSQQTNHSALSRNGTPQLPAATPHMAPRNMTPNPQMTQASGVMVNGMHNTPVMGQQNMMRTPQMSHQGNMSPAQQAAMMSHQHQQEMQGRGPAMRNQAHANGQMGQSPNPNQFAGQQFSPQQRAMMQSGMLHAQRNVPAAPSPQAQGSPNDRVAEYKALLNQNQRMSAQAAQRVASGQGVATAGSMQQSPGHMQQFRPPSSSAGSPGGGVQMAQNMSRGVSQFGGGASNAANGQVRMGPNQQLGMQQGNAAVAMQQQFFRALAQRNGGQIPPDAAQKWEAIKHQQMMNLHQRQQQQATQQAQQLNQHQPGSQQMMMPGQGLQQAGYLQHLQSNGMMQANQMNPMMIQHLRQQQQMQAQQQRLAMGGGPQGAAMMNSMMNAGHPGYANGMSGMPHQGGAGGGGMG